MAKTVHKYRILTEHLLEMIASLPPGHRLPTVGELKQQYGVSQATVDKALAYLKENNYVDAAPYRGITVKDPRGHVADGRTGSVRAIYFGSPGSLLKSEFHGTLLERLNIVVGSKGGWLQTTCLPATTTAAEFALHLDGVGRDGLILISVYNPEIHEMVRRRSAPFVLVCPDCPQTLTNSILIDNRKIVQLWVEHLMGLGHRKIAYLHTAVEEHFQRDPHQRRQFFFEELGKCGIAPDPDLVKYSGYNEEWGARATRQLLETGKEFTAVICNDSNACGVYKALNEHGLTVGQDISVVSVNNQIWTSHMYPPLTTVDISRQEMAELAVGELERMATPGEPVLDTALVGSKLVVRSSTAPAAVGRDEQDM